jgi:hypothetical protein
MDVNELQSQRDAWDAERASYEELVGRLRSDLSALRGGEASSPRLIGRYNNSHRGERSMPAPTPALAENPDRRPTMDCPICPDPDPDCPCQQRETNVSAPPPPPVRPTPLAALHLAVKAMAEADPSPTPGGTSCGVCQTNEECLCQVIDDLDKEDVKPTIFPTPSPEIGLGGSMLDGCGLCTSASFCACKANVGSSSNSSQSPVMGIASITSGVMATSTKNPYQASAVSTAAVPLRLGRNKRKGATIWSLDPPAAPPPTKPVEAECSGDPSNCDACRDDSFGKHFSVWCGWMHSDR